MADTTITLRLLNAYDTVTIFVFLLSCIVAYQLISTLYIAFWGPLSKYPGPTWNKLSQYPWIIAQCKGKDLQYVSALHRKHGDVVRVGPKELSYLGTPEVWTDIYGHRKAGNTKPGKDPAFYEAGIEITENLVNSLSDQEHSRQRRILAHAFSDAALREQEPLLKSFAVKMKNKICRDCHEQVDMVKVFNFTTFDIMADLTFGEDLGMLDSGMYVPWVKTVFAAQKSGTFFRVLRTAQPTRFLEKWWHMSESARMKSFEHFNFSKERVDKRMARTPDKPDLWSRILAKSVADGGLSQNEQYVNSSFFMTAGTETTATLLSGLTYYLGKNPKVLQKVQQEVRANIKGFEDMTLESLTRLTYLNACLQEALRLYPPVPVALPRCVRTGGTKIAGEWVPEGTRVGIHHYSTYHSEENFKHASQFVPERWLGDPQYANDRLSIVEPFLIGPRNCIGKNLAWHTMRLLSATVLLHFDLRLAEGANNWTTQDVYTLWEKHPLMCHVAEV